MRGLRFDPSSAVTFDLDSGLIHLPASESPRVLVPAGALGALCAAAGPAAAAAFGRDLGVVMGRRVASRLAVPAAAVEAVVEHLGAELALTGLGTLGIERWGRALVMVLDRCPLGAEVNALLEAVFEGAIEGAAGRAVRAVLLHRDAVRARLLIGSGAAADRARAWLAGGVSWGEVLVKLHAPRGEA